MPEPEVGRLQTWINNNLPEENMLWKNAWLDQVIFVRDQVAGLLATSYAQYKDMVDVVATHTSKSIKCPVYFAHVQTLEHGVDIWMRYNFFNWNISVQSDKPITCNFVDCFSDENYGYCYCEGMERWKFGRYSDSQFKFTICLYSDYDAFVFFRVLRKFLGIKKTD